ncbi:MAG: STAS domain-containing protein [Muribaculaceae bacterium]|nr:STAS domain-containing protein [Muribaculaceae bacterium]
MNFNTKVEYCPKLIKEIKNYDITKFKNDLVSGIVVGIVALPLAIAFGIASGVTPSVGLITAIIGGFLVSALGGNSVQIGGPTGAFIVIVYGIIQNFGLTGLAVATFMAGLILVLLGLFKLGTVIKFIPYPIVIGFTSGIALTIFSTQIVEFFGMQPDVAIPSDFIGKWNVYFHYIATINIPTMIVGTLTVLIICIMPKISSKMPAALIAIILMTVMVYFLKGVPGCDGVATIGDRFGVLKAQIPHPDGLPVNMNMINQLLPSAFTIAMLGAIESLLSATVADGATGNSTDTNSELIGQGVANVVVPFFGGIPVTGAIARTMTNITNGGRTPVAGVVHAIVLLLIFLFLMPLISYVPMACLAGVLVMVSYNMSGWRTVRAMLKNPKSDVSVLIVTFLLTVVFDLTIAIELGLLLAIVLFIRRVMENTSIKVLSNEIDVADGTDLSLHEILHVANGVEIYEIDGPFFFGVATKFDEMMRSMGEKPIVRIIRMRRVPFIDSTGVHNLEILIQSSKKDGVHVVLSGVNDNVRGVLENSGIVSMLGEDHICSHITEAVSMANSLADDSGELRKIEW